MAIPALGIIPWLGAQGSRFRKVPAMLYMWLTIIGPIILLLLYSKPIPIWYSALVLYSTGHIVATIALQSSGATISDPEYTKESNILLSAVQVLAESVETIKDLFKDHEIVDKKPTKK